MWASGARSPEAPTEPWHGHDRDQVAARASPRAARRSRGRTPEAPCAEAGELQRHHQPHDRRAASARRRRPRARARCCAAACARSAGLDAHAGELAEAGVDAVDRLALGDDARRPRAALAAIGGRAGRIERDARAAIDGAPVGERDTAPAASTIAAHRAPPDARVQWVEAHAVDELGRPLDVPDGEVARTCRPRACRSRRAGRARARPRG